MTLYCAICMFVPAEPHDAKEAVTVLGGYAVCDDHLGYVTQGEGWHAILGVARR